MSATQTHVAPSDPGRSVGRACIWFPATSLVAMVVSVALSGVLFDWEEALEADMVWGYSAIVFLPALVFAGLFYAFVIRLGDPSRPVVLSRAVLFGVIHGATAPLIVWGVAAIGLGVVMFAVFPPALFAYWSRRSEAPA